MRGQRLEDPAEIAGLIDAADYAVLSMADGDAPYAVPLNAAWDGEYFYLHGKHGGRKMEILRKNPRVSLTFVPRASFALRSEKNACGAGSMDFESVCASGVAEILGSGSSLEERRAALLVLVRRYGLEHLPMDDGGIAQTSVIRVRCESLVALRKTGNPV